MNNYDLHFGRFRLKVDPSKRFPLVMGVLNITPDSFSDAGSYFSLDAALSHAEEMIAAGVDIIDIGGESSRPGAAVLTVEEELRRVMPVLYALRDSGKPLSVDTCKPDVMRAVIDAGADMINDINGFRAPDALRAVKQSDCALCIMHMQNTPQTMQNDPQYANVLEEVGSFLQERIDAIESEGIARSRLVVDPGFGFGKNLEHNPTLLRGIGELESLLGLPVLAGLSRKSMLGAITGRPVDQRVAASLAAALVAAERGAAIVRVHDVAETIDAMKVWHAARK